MRVRTLAQGQPRYRLVLTPLDIALAAGATDAGSSAAEPVIEPEPALGPDPNPNLAPERIPERVVEAPPSPQPDASLVGCWRWSNGAFITVGADGKASNGLASGSPWTAISDTQFEIEWPPISGEITLDSGGRSLSSVDFLGARSTAQRIDGDPSGLAGTWSWDNGAVITFGADGAFSVGPLGGTWIRDGAGYAYAYPLHDEITVAADGESLEGGNQFGDFTARKAPCP